MLGAGSRTPEHPSRPVQSGPVGQCEYTNAARGGGWNHLLSYTNELRGNLDKNAVQAGGISFLLSGHTAESPTGLPSPIWSCFAIASCPSTVAAPEWLKMPFKLMLSSPLQALPSNPSIEGIPKRLRLLCTPHVKR
jgi:hypothetical protein